MRNIENEGIKNKMFIKLNFKFNFKFIFEFNSQIFFLLQNEIDDDQRNIENERIKNKISIYNIAPYCL